MDSFISASASHDFKLLILIDTSSKPLGTNAQSVIDNIEKEYIRIQLEELEESRIDWVSYVNQKQVKLHPQLELRDHQIQAIEAIKDGFKKKFLEIKNKISYPIFKEYNAHGAHKDKKFNEIKIFASIFRKKIKK